LISFFKNKNSGNINSSRIFFYYLLPFFPKTTFLPNFIFKKLKENVSKYLYRENLSVYPQQAHKFLLKRIGLLLFSRNTFALTSSYEYRAT